MPKKKKSKSKGLPRRTKLEEVGPKSNDSNYIALILLLVALVANIIVLISLL